MQANGSLRHTAPADYLTIGQKIFDEVNTLTMQSADCMTDDSIRGYRELKLTWLRTRARHPLHFYLSCQSSSVELGIFTDIEFHPGGHGCLARWDISGPHEAGLSVRGLRVVPLAPQPGEPARYPLRLDTSADYNAGLVPLISDLAFILTYWLNHSLV